MIGKLVSGRKRPNSTLIVSLSVAAVTAITLLAYYHPHAYRKIYLPLVGLLVVAMSATVFWFFATSYTYTTLSSFFESKRYDEARRALESIQPPVGTLLIFWVIALFYLTFLLTLPLILENKEQDKPKEPSPKKDEEKP